LGITRATAFRISASRSTPSGRMWSGARPEAIDWHQASSRIVTPRATKTCSVERREK
jgi:hypothetical protein